MQDTQWPTMGQRIDQLGITAVVVYGAEPNENYPDSHHPWTVTLRMGRRQMTVPFYQPPLQGHEPTAAEVLARLASDAGSYENSGGVFEEWCGEYGEDSWCAPTLVAGPDSRRAERTFRQVEQQRAMLRRFLGSEYDTILWRTERL